MTPRLVVVGSANTDLVVRVPRLPRPGETITAGRFAVVAGGKGANQAAAAARAGARVEFVADIGRDDFGPAARESLRRQRISTRHLVRSETARRAAALILGDWQGQNLNAAAA